MRNRRRGMTLIEGMVTTALLSMLMVSGTALFRNALFFYVQGNAKIEVSRNVQMVANTLINEARHAYNIGFTITSAGSTVTFSTNPARGGTPNEVRYTWDAQTQTVTRQAGSGPADYLANKITDFAPIPLTPSTSSGLKVRVASSNDKRTAVFTTTLYTRVYCAQPVQSSYYSPEFWSAFWAAYPYGVDYGRKNP